IRALRGEQEAGGSWIEASRHSLHSKVLLHREQLTLASDPAEAAAQVAALFDMDDASAHPPSNRLQELIASGEDSDALSVALQTYYESLQDGSDAFDYFLSELAELSLFPRALPFVSEVASFVAEKRQLSAKVFHLHHDRKLFDALHQFTCQAIQGEQPDGTLFRADTLPAMIAGLVVKETVRQPLERLLQAAPLIFVVDDMESMVIALDQLTPQLFNLIETSEELKPLVQTTRVAPIRAHFSDEEADVIEGCIYRGIVDMVFLRGLCPCITQMESQERAQKVALAQFIMRFVNKQPYPEDSKARLNSLMLKYQGQLDALITSFSRRPS
ncbi:MAG: hypothetical protein K940chlam2_00993, partial [Chlamydiae bacterium]|nr:hypothetical protein [Chlamydiota bacterium]